MLCFIFLELLLMLPPFTYSAEKLTVPLHVLQHSIKTVFIVVNQNTSLRGTFYVQEDCNQS